MLLILDIGLGIIQHLMFRLAAAAILGLLTFPADPVMHHELDDLTVVSNGIHFISYTFQMVQENTDVHWYFQRFSLIHEYYERPWLPPPFILFIHIYMMFKWCIRGCNHRPLSSDFSEYRV